MTRAFTYETLRLLCQKAGVGEFCSSAALDPAQVDQLQTLVARVVRIERGVTFCRQDADAADMLFRIRTGALKSTHEGVGLTPCVTGFWLAGDVAGLDAFHSSQRRDTLVALVSSEVECIPVSQLTAGDDILAGLTVALWGLLSRELSRREQQLMLVAQASSEQRMVVFLISLLMRTGLVQTNSVLLELCMTRQEIAAFLGLRTETVSRRLREMHRRGLIKLNGRRIVACNLAELLSMAGLATEAVRSAGVVGG